MQRALELGLRNREVLELARRHCLNLEFRQSGGRGLAEAASGLPINMREVFCQIGGRGAMGSNLRWIAGDYVREHCVGCDARRPTGDVPNLLTEIEAELAAQSREQASRRVEAEEAAAAALHRRAVRLAVLASADAGTVQLRTDLDLVDSPQRDDPGAAAAAFERLETVALRAPELFAPELTEQLFGLVREQKVDRLLRSLRHLARAGATPVTGVLALAIETLAARPDPDAAACLAEFATSICADAITLDVIDSCVRLIAGPVYTGIGRRRTPAGADPAGFLAAADANLPLVLTHVASLLAAAPPEPSRLILPNGMNAPSSPSRDAAAADERRHQGAVAAACLIASRRCGWPQLAGPLLDALSQSDADDFDLRASHEVKTAIAEALVRDFDHVFTDLSAQVPHSREHAERLVACLEYLARMLDPDDRYLHRDFDPPAVEDLATQLCRAAVGLLDGRWGEASVHRVADLIQDLARHHPGQMAEHADPLLGYLLLEHAPTVAEPARLLMPPDPLRALERGSLAFLRDAAIRDLRHALADCAAVQAGRVIQAVLRADAAQADPPASADHAETRRVRTLRRQNLELLGEIAQKHGTQTGVLALVLPLLYRRLLGEDQVLRAQSIKIWAALAARYPLPSSLADCGQALLSDTFLIVQSAVMKHGTAILHERDQSLLVNKAIELVVKYADDPDWTQLVTCAMRVVYGHLDLWACDDQLAVEQWLLTAAAKLPAHEAHRIANLPGWSAEAAHSAPMALLRLAFITDPQINDRFNDRADEAYVRLCETGDGGDKLPFDDVQRIAAGFLPDRPWDAVLLVEALQSFARWQEAEELARHLHADMPTTPAYDSYRTLLADTLEHASLQTTQPIDHAPRPSGDAPGASTPREQSPVAQQVSAISVARRALRTAPGTPLQSTAPGSGAPPPSAAPSALMESSVSLIAAHPNQTPTGQYVRVWAHSLRIAAHLLQAHAALRDANVETEAANLRAAAVRAEEALQAAGPDNALWSPLREWLRSVAAPDSATRPDRLAAALAQVPVPLCLARGETLPTGMWSAGSTDEQTPTEPTLVCLTRIDDRPVSYTQVLHPGRSYTLRLEMRMEHWPEWAERLEVQLVSVLGPDELVLPGYAWTSADTTPGDGYLSVADDKTLLLRFTLGAGQPPQSVRIVAVFHSSDARAEIANLAGHTELRLRPFDASRDALTDFPQLDERLLAVYDRVRQFTQDEPTLQAFCRLLTAVCAVSAELTYDQHFRRGTHVSERKFHDEVDARLKQDPLLGGRVLRATRQGLGITDVVHDAVTCELKVERKAAFDRQRAKHYLGQAVQYASAVQKQLSILFVLDTTRKTQPVGVQANYLWLVRPELHAGAEGPDASLVAVVVANSDLSVPSAWSRRTIAATEVELD